MIKNKKQMYIVVGTFILVLMLFTTTYAFFNYTRTGTSNTIKVGRISFVTRQTSTINLVNVFPIDNEDVDTDTDNVDEVVIEIEGDTDYVDGIEYLVSSVDSSIYTSSGVLVPISLDITVDGLGTENNNYFTARDSKNANIYKQLVGDTLVGDQMLLVGYIKKNTTNGVAEGVDGSITIKAYFDKDKILISDTYDGTESDNMGTTNAMTEGKTVITTSEWNALQSSGLSFKVKVEANESIWVNEPLYNVIKLRNLNTTTGNPIMDNENSEFVQNTTPGIDFTTRSSDTNGKGIYMMASTQNDAYPIMYYRGSVTDNNIIFANKCWKMVRTTDTGGIKVIYNGIPLGPKNNLTNDDYTLLTNTGDFTYDSTDNTWTTTITESISYSNRKEISFNVPEDDNYYGVYSVDLISGQTLNVKGLYTNSLSATSNSTTENYGRKRSTDVIKIEYYGNGTVENPITLKIKMLFSDESLGLTCNTASANMDLPQDANSYLGFSRMTNSPAYVGYMYGDVYVTNHDTSLVTDALYASSFTWDGTNYTLSNDSQTSLDANHRYSCGEANATICNDIRYYFYYNFNYNKYSYVILSDGVDIEEAVERMHQNNNDSNAKHNIDGWYERNLLDYTNRLEDTIWCNDRSTTEDEVGKILNVFFDGYYSTYVRVRRNSQPSIKCPQKNDSFTVNNGLGNKALTYPIAMLTADELSFGGVSSSSLQDNYLNIQNAYWTLSPSGYDGTDYGTSNVYVVTSGSFVYGGTGSTARWYHPSISLKNDAVIIDGDGTKDNPFIVE